MKSIKEKLYRLKETLEFLQMSKATLYKLIKEEPLLEPIKIAGKNYWSIDKLDKYIDDKIKNLKQK